MNRCAKDKMQRNVVMFLRHPDCLVAITCRVENVKVKETESKVEKAVAVKRKELSSQRVTSKKRVVLPDG